MGFTVLEGVQIQEKYQFSVIIFTVYFCHLCELYAYYNTAKYQRKADRGKNVKKLQSAVYSYTPMVPMKLCKLCINSNIDITYYILSSMVEDG